MTTTLALRRTLALPMVLAMALAMLFAGTHAALADAPSKLDELLDDFDGANALDNAALNVTITSDEPSDPSVYLIGGVENDPIVGLIKGKTYLFEYSATGAGLEDDDAIIIRAFDDKGAAEEILGPDLAASSLSTTVEDAAEGSFAFGVPGGLTGEVTFVVSIEREEADEDLEVLFVQFTAKSFADPEAADAGDENRGPSLFIRFSVSTIPAPVAPAPAPSAPAAAAPVEQPAGGAQFVDASGTPIDPTIAVADGAMTVSAGGFDTTLAGDGGATAASGPVTSESGSFTTTIEGDIPEGSVVEVWMFSEPRLVAAGLSDGGGTLSIDVPTGAPLDGGDPIPAGTHTMQLLIPTASGVVAMNVGVTVGGPVPASVPAGEGQVPTAPFAIAALLAVGATALVGRRTLVAPTA